MSDQPGDRYRRMQQRCLITAEKLRLGRTERLEVASYVLDREISSFNQLSPPELSRLIDVFDGSYYVLSIIVDKQRGERSRRRVHKPSNRRNSA